MSRHPAWHASLLLLAVLVGAGRWVALPDFVESVDGWLFVRGVERYSVAELRPHWPGYPVYIAAGKLLRPLAGDAAGALHLLSLLASVASALLLAALARSWTAAGGADAAASNRAGFAAGAAFSATPLACLAGVQILSDGFGLVLALLLLLVSWEALRAPRAAPSLVAAGAIGALLLGARLAYLPLLLPALYAGWCRRGSEVRVAGWRVDPALVLLAPLALGVVAWGGLQLAVEGPTLLGAASVRLHEHFGAWWLRTLSDGRWWQRPLELGRTLAIHGLGLWAPGTPAVRLAATLALPLLALAGLGALVRHPDRKAAHLLGLFAGGQILGVLLAHDPALDRHGLPLVAALSLLAALGLPPRDGRRAMAALAILVVSLLVASVPVAAARAATPPPAALLARYTTGHLDPERATILVTSDVPYVGLFLEELAPGTAFEHVSGAGLPAAADRLATAGREVYSTAPSPLSPGEWAPLACFDRPPLVESRGPAQLWLYRRGPWSGSTPSCFGPGRLP